MITELQRQGPGTPVVLEHHVPGNLHIERWVRASRLGLARLRLDRRSARHAERQGVDPKHVQPDLTGLVDDVGTGLVLVRPLLNPQVGCDLSLLGDCHPLVEHAPHGPQAGHLQAPPCERPPELGQQALAGLLLRHEADLVALEEGRLHVRQLHSRKELILIHRVHGQSR